MRFSFAITTVTCVTLLAGCSSPQTTYVASSDVQTDSLVQLQLLHAKRIKLSDQQGLSTIRARAIREVATSLGAQGGLAYRSKLIDNMLNRQRKYLDFVFNFNAILLKENVLPPVLQETDKNLHLDNDSAIRLADKTYIILKPARFVTAAPRWRDYLWMAYQTPEQPPASMLPRNIEEQKIWNQYIVIGWKQGLDQGHRIFTANLGRLKRDYNGMTTYRKLYAQNMVSAPYVAKTDLGITGDKNEMHINDQVLRITAKSELKYNTKQWKAVLTRDRS